jgi:transcriptional regulator with XRE-family HTH domain
MMPEPQELRVIVGNNIRKWREELGLSQSQLAARMTGNGFRWSATTVAEVEKTQRRLTVDELMAMAGCLALDATALLVADVPVTIGNVTVENPSIFNMWLDGRVRLWTNNGELSVIQRPKDVITIHELPKQHRELFINEEED